MENIMDEQLVNHYINMMANRVNELTQENILLKAKLTLSQEKLNAQTTETQKVDGNSNKTKEK